MKVSNILIRTSQIIEYYPFIALDGTITLVSGLNSPAEQPLDYSDRGHKASASQLQDGNVSSLQAQGIV